MPNSTAANEVGSEMVGLQSPHPIDLHIGLRIRQLRTVIGLTQQMLGAAAGLSRQQVQIYETGAHSVPVRRLFKLALALDVSPSFFFEGPRFSRKALLHRRETMEFVRAYSAIHNTSVRESIAEMIRTIATRQRTLS